MPLEQAGRLRRDQRDDWRARAFPFLTTLRGRTGGPGGAPVTSDAPPHLQPLFWRHVDGVRGGGFLVSDIPMLARREEFFLRQQAPLLLEKPL